MNPRKTSKKIISSKKKSSKHLVKSVSETVYDPQEDSFLLSECTKKYAFGKVLDMGTGSGIQGFSALKNKKVEYVLFADINPKAIEFVKNELKIDEDLKTIIKHKKIEFIVSNLYSKISKVKYSKKFDTIIFNPPYLPEDEFDDEKLITTGGKKGYEIYDAFLKSSNNYLSDSGQILILFSSITGRDKIDSIVKKFGFNKYLISRKKLFMEELFVYQLKKENNNIFKGHRGIVTIKNIRIKNKLIKVAIKTSIDKNYSLENEAKFLKILSKKNIGPKLYKFDKKNNSIIMEYVSGKRIEDFILNSNYEHIKSVLTNILEQLLIMDNLKINKFEMTNPYKHIIVNQKKSTKQKFSVTMIDFERATYTNRPKNITQFLQYLTSGKIEYLFKKKNIFVNKNEIRTIAKTYSIEKNNSNIISSILDCISHNT